MQVLTHATLRKKFRLSVVVFATMPMICFEMGFHANDDVNDDDDNDDDVNDDGNNDDDNDVDDCDVGNEIWVVNIEAKNLQLLFHIFFR